MKADPVRRLAHEILIAVDRGGPLDPLLNRGLDRTVAPRDRAFLAELVRGTLQWQGRYDHLIARFAHRKPPTDSATRTLLRMTLHQMIGQSTVPAYAAIHQAGEICRLRPGRRKLPFVNGLLQSVRRELLGEEAAGPLSPEARELRLRPFFDSAGTDPLDRLAAWQSHPRWLVGKWAARFGLEKTAAICAWNNRPVPLVFHVLEPCEPRRALRELEAAGCPVSPGSRERTLIARARVGRETLDGILARCPWLIVQDAAVQDATDWLVGGTLPYLPAGDPLVLDMCAAPGGKTAFLVSRWPGNGRIVAMDRTPARIGLLDAGMKRIETDRVDVLLADGKRPPFAPGSFGAVLLDGPCSGSGVLRHHPDGRWRLDAGVPRVKGATLAKLADLAVELLRPGGLLMYATCSLEPEENEEVVDGLLQPGGRMEPAPGADGFWRRFWLPGEADGDGFFAARLRRKD